MLQPISQLTQSESESESEKNNINANKTNIHTKAISFSLQNQNNHNYSHNQPHAQSPYTLHNIQNHPYSRNNNQYPHHQNLNLNQNQNQNLYQNRFSNHCPYISNRNSQSLQTHIQRPRQRQRQSQNQSMDEIKRVQVSLPVYKFKKLIKDTVIQNPITLIVGETGSGKTTQIPQYLLEWEAISPSSRIVCTQPRTVAAIGVAERVSIEQCKSCW